MGNVGFWNIVAIMFIVLGMVYIEKTIEFGGLLTGFFAMIMYSTGWALFLSYDDSVARPIGMVLPFLSIATYIYTSWVVSRDKSDIIGLRPMTFTFWLLWFGAWMAYIYFKSMSQAPQLGALNIMGFFLIVLGSFLIYAGVPRRYTMSTILGSTDSNETTYYATTVLSPVFVLITAGWSLLAMNQVIDTMY